MTTLTADAAQTGIALKEVANGISVVFASYSWSATPSAGEVINLFRIPGNSYLLQLIVSGTSPGAAAGQTLDFGTNGLSNSTSISYFASAITLSASMVPVFVGGTAANTLPLFLGVSDDAANQFVTITAKTAAAGSGSATSVLKVTAMYARKGVANTV